MKNNFYYDDEECSESEMASVAMTGIMVVSAIVLIFVTMLYYLT